MADNKPRFRLYRNRHKCESCGEQNLPEPIVFAKCSRLDGTYVCDRCYADHNYTIALEQNAKLFDDAQRGDA
jgi:formylmethanofuran dehydrogenase subunit E